MTGYEEFLDRKRHSADEGGFAPTWLPDALKPFQRILANVAERAKRGAA